MNTKSIIGGALLAIASASASAGGAQAANLVVNGDFESLTSQAAAGGYHICDNTQPTCVSVLTGWTATAGIFGPLGTNSPGAVMLGGNGGAEWNSGIGLYGPIPDSPVGGNFIGIDGDPVYSQMISQVINGLTVGKIYKLSFYQAAAQQNGLTGPTTEQWQVTFGNTTQLSTNQFNPSQSFLPWTLETMLFTATSASETLSFLALGTPAGMPPVVLLDGVSLTGAVPEPATWAMLVLGFGFVGVASRRRKTIVAA